MPFNGWLTRIGSFGSNQSERPMESVTVQFRMSSPMEEALWLAAQEDGCSLGDVVRQAVAREMRRRQEGRPGAARTGDGPLT